MALTEHTYLGRLDGFDIYIKKNPTPKNTFYQKVAQIIIDHEKLMQKN